jgi:SAM-dependent methyltransferase
MPLYPVSNAYFKYKAKQYDDVDKQYYWKLSDDLLWWNLQKFLKKLPKNFRFLDAGGGTGRWSERILHSYPHATGVICDISTSMLDVAETKMSKEISQKRLALVCQPLEEYVNTNSFDVCFNFHNVLGFVKNPKLTISNLAASAKRGGFVISMVPNLYHLLFFTISQNRSSEAFRVMRTSMGRFTNTMPYIHLFTPESIRKIYKLASLTTIYLGGFPITIYPFFQETQISGNSHGLSELLGDKTIFNRILKVEKSLYAQPDIASRGNNLFIVGIK